MRYRIALLSLESFIRWFAPLLHRFQMTQLVAQLTRMCQLLMMEVNAQPEPAIGPILDRYFTYQIMEMVLDWAIQVPDFLKPTCQV